MSGEKRQRRVDPAVADRVLASHPAPIADALEALLASGSVFEERDRVVETFRAVVRVLAAIVVASTLQLGPGPGGASREVAELLRALRSRGLTDGQWIALIREGLRGWVASPAAFPVPEIVTLVHARKSELLKLFDELLVMRKSETVAHGATGTRDAIAEILERRMPQLERVLDLLAPAWVRARFACPLDGEGAAAPTHAALLMGTSPRGDRLRRVELADGPALVARELFLLGSDGSALLSLHPIALLRRPMPDAPEELFFHDGAAKRGALYVALPSMAEHRDPNAWSAFDQALADDEGGAPTTGGDAAPKGRPYKGLASFGPDDASLFFGREHEAEHLANRIRRQGFVTVTGASGSGKSSLLRAGVLPLLRDTSVAFMRPGSDPLGVAAARIADALGEDRDAFVALARSGPEAFAARVDATAYRQGKRLIVVVDQGEEVLTLTADPEAREAFAKVLVMLASADGHVSIVFSLREDFFGRLGTIPSLREVCGRAVEIVTTPDRAALVRTLVAPAQAFGYAFEDEPLVMSMVDAVEGTPTALALLQFAADRLWDARDRKWKRMTAEAYRAIGGVEGALAQHADQVLAGMTAKEKTVCRAIFMRLVSGERTRAVIKRAELESALADRDSGRSVLDALVGARLVSVSDAESGETTVELVHEALIKHWSALDRWLGEDEEGQRLTHAMRLAAREWASRDKPRDLLYRGDVLDELRRYRRRGADLHGLEAEFADSSEAEAKRGRRIRVGLVAGALAVLAGFSVFAAYEWRTTAAAQAEAVRQRKETEKEKNNVEIRGLIAEARAHEPAGRTLHALALLRAATQLEMAQGAADKTTLSIEEGALARRGPGGILVGGAGAAVFHTCLPKGKDRVIITALDETVRVVVRSTGEIVASVPSLGNVAHGLACSADGSTFTIGATDAKEKQGRLATYNADDGRLVRNYEGIEAPVDRLVNAGDGRVAVFTNDGVLYVVDTKTGRIVRKLSDAQDRIYDFDISADGTRLVTTNGEAVTLFALDASDPVWSVKSKARIATVAMESDGARVAWAALEGGVVSFADAADGKVERQLKPVGTLGVAHIGFAPGKNVLATSGPNGLDLWDTTTGETTWSTPSDRDQPDVTFAPDGSRLATRAGLRVEVWDTETGAHIAELSGHDAEIEDVAFSSDAQTVVTASFDRTAIIHDISKPRIVGASRPGNRIIDTDAMSDAGRVLVVDDKGAVSISKENLDERSPEWLRLPSANSGHAAVAMSPDGSRVIIAKEKGGASLYAAPAFDRAIDVEGGPFTAVAFGPDALALGEESGAVRILGINGEARARWEGDASPVTRIAWSPKGDLVAIGWSSRRLRFVGAAKGDALDSPEDTIGPAADIAFSPDGAWGAVADQQRVRWFDTSTWEARESKDHDQAVLSVVFSPDSTLLASAGADSTIALRTRDKLERKLQGGASGTLELAFSPDGTRILSTDQDGVVHIFDVALGVPEDTMTPGGAIRSARFLDADHVAVVGSRLVATLLVPAPDTRRDIDAAGEMTNMRVCEATFAVVPVVPQIASIFAPESACRTASDEAAPASH